VYCNVSKVTESTFCICPVQVFDNISRLAVSARQMSLVLFRYRGSSQNPIQPHFSQFHFIPKRYLILPREALCSLPFSVLKCFLPEQIYDLLSTKVLHIINLLTNDKSFEYSTKINRFLLLLIRFTHKSYYYIVQNNRHHNVKATDWFIAVNVSYKALYTSNVL
jgi:hypothetical protein